MTTKTITKEEFDKALKEGGIEGLVGVMEKLADGIMQETRQEAYDYLTPELIDEHERFVNHLLERNRESHKDIDENTREALFLEGLVAGALMTVSHLNTDGSVAMDEADPRVKLAFMLDATIECLGQKNDPTKEAIKLLKSIRDGYEKVAKERSKKGRVKK